MKDLKLSPAKMKAAICASPLARLLIKHNLSGPVYDYLKPISGKTCEQESEFYESMLNNWAANIPKNRLVPAVCKRLAYHLENFINPASAVPKSEYALKTIIRKLREKAGFSYLQTDYLELISLEPETLTILDTGEIVAEYNS